jgi:ligand-binding sensor protein
MKVIPQNDIVILEQPEFMKKMASSPIELSASAKENMVQEFYREHSGLYIVFAVGPIVSANGYPGVVPGAKVRLSDNMYIKPFTIKDGDKELSYIMTNAHNISLVLED